MLKKIYLSLGDDFGDRDMQTGKNGPGEREDACQVRSGLLEMGFYRLCMSQVKPSWAAGSGLETG